MKCKYCKQEIPEGSIFCMYCGERVAKKKRNKQEIKVPKPRQLPSGAWNIELRKEGASVTESTPELCESKARAIRAGYIKKEKPPAELKLTDAMTKYIESRKGTVSPGTIATYKKKQELYFQDLMQTNIYDITDEMVQLEIAKMMTVGGKKGKPLAAKTVKDVVSLMLGAMRFCGHDVDRERLSQAPVQASPFSVLTDQEISTLLKALHGNPCELQILLALWLGLRRSEIMALEKSDFDTTHNTVTIDKALVRDDNKKWVIKGTKTSKSARTISCPDHIITLVENAPDGRLYHYDPNYILKCLKRVCKENNLPPIRLHDSRHINASVGLKLGISDKYMMERGGWSSKDTMVYRYEHTYADEKAAADKAMNDHFNHLLTCNFTNEITNENKTT